MNTNKKQKEVDLDENVITILKEKAKQQGRNLKNYMEFVLSEDAYAFEPSASYKLMIDKMIEDHEQGKKTYTSWKDAKKELLD